MPLSKAKRLIFTSNLILAIFFIYSCNVAWGNSSDRVQEIIQKAESGDLIFRYSEGLWSTLAANLSFKDRRFSHVGIIMIENDTVDVIHADGSPLEGAPSLVRQPIEQWVNGSKRLGLFGIDVEKKTRNRIAQEAYRLFHANIPFDTSFDLSTDDKLYCTEFVEKIVSFVQLDNHDTPVIFDRQRFVDGRLYIPLDSLYVNDRVTEKVIVINE